MKNFQLKGSNNPGLTLLVTILLIALTTALSSFISDSGKNNGEQDKAKVLPLSQRIGHLDQSKAMAGKLVHQGAGTLYIQTILGRGAISGLNFMHIGPLMPQSSIGSHFHNNTDEMFLILDADCEFTVNGKTAVLPGPVGVPCPAGNSHAVYNPSDKPAMWVNFQVGDPNSSYGGPSARGAYNFSADPNGSFDLYDNRVGVTLEKPTFNHTRQLTKESLRAVANMHGGKETVMYRRALGPSVFATNWAFVDHLMIPPKASVGSHYHNGVEEIYLVIKGKGIVKVNDEQADIIYGDAIPVRAKEIHSLENNSDEPLELIVYGVALEKGKLDVTDVKQGLSLPLMKLQMYFEVAPENFDAFERNYIDSYVPALRKQAGYISSKLLRLFPGDVATKIGAAKTKYNYQMELIFDTEEHRQLWTKTKEHDIAWPLAISFVKSYAWAGFDVAGLDQVKYPLPEARQIPNSGTMKLQMFFEVDPAKGKAFEQNYTDVYVPALRKQVGYLGSRLLRVFPAEVSKKIAAAETKFNYQMELIFDSEGHRQAWTKTKEHDIAWPLTTALVKSFEWKGFNIVGIDQVTNLLPAQTY
jgi:mannose-6-phosphate isomerase-like protein (cupin superfamily)